MQFMRSKSLQALLAAVVTAMVVMPIAIAGASGHAAGRPASKSITKQLKALKKQAAALAKQVAALEGALAPLQDQVTQLKGKQFPASLPPSGPAGGDLTGTFPKPTIGPAAVGSLEITDGTVSSADIADGAVGSADIAGGAVGSAAIADGSVGSADIGDESIGSSDIADGSISASDFRARSVGGSALVDATPLASANGTTIKANETGVAIAGCPGSARLVSGGFEWEHPESNLSHITMSRPDPQSPSRIWEVQGHVDGGAANSLIAWALCLG
jgi:hypothetical protein